MEFVEKVQQIIEKIEENHYADLGDSMSIIQVMNKVKPTEVYNLAAQSHDKKTVRTSGVTGFSKWAKSSFLSRMCPNTSLRSRCASSKIRLRCSFLSALRSANPLRSMDGRYVRSRGRSRNSMGSS